MRRPARTCFVLLLRLVWGCRIGGRRPVGRRRARHQSRAGFDVESMRGQRLWHTARRCRLALAPTWRRHADRRDRLWPHRRHNLARPKLPFCLAESERLRYVNRPSEKLVFVGVTWVAAMPSAPKKTRTPSRVPPLDGTTNINLVSCIRRKLR